MSRQQYIPLSALSVTYTPPALEKPDGKDEPEFTLRQPTEGEAERLGFELYRLGFSPISQETVRATMIDEIYNLYTKDVDGSPDETEADTKASILEEVWQHEAAYQAQVQLWTEQERQRLADKKVGVPVEDAAEFPTNPCPVRTRARSQLLIDDIIAKSQRMRNLTVEQNGYQFVQARWILRIYITGWKGLKVKPEFENDALTDACLDALINEIGATARRQLSAHIEDLFDLAEEERKNSDLPAESGPPENGSPEPSDASASSGGNSTASSSEATPAAESDESTAKS